ncbi:DUF2971 domain-containing protein, partial [bacterium]
MRGVAIGFNKKFLSLSYPVPKSTLVECIYTDHIDFIKSVIEKKIYEIQDIINAYGKSRASNVFIEDIRNKPDCLNILFTELLRIKNEAFKEEQEVRLVFHVPTETVK